MIINKLEWIPFNGILPLFLWMSLRSNRLSTNDKPDDGMLPESTNPTLGSCISLRFRINHFEWIEKKKGFLRCLLVVRRAPIGIKNRPTGLTRIGSVGHTIEATLCVCARKPYIIVHMRTLRYLSLFRSCLSYNPKPGLPYHNHMLSLIVVCILATTLYGIFCFAIAFHSFFGMRVWVCGSNQKNMRHLPKWWNDASSLTCPFFVLRPFSLSSCVCLTWLLHKNHKIKNAKDCLWWLYTYVLLHYAVCYMFTM